MEITRKRFDINIVNEGKKHSKTFELDKTSKFIKGIIFTSDREDLMFYRGSLRLEINGKELFPEKYESKLLMTSLNVEANKRYYNLSEVMVGNGIIKLDYQDDGNPNIPFEPYRVSLYLETQS
jgi:hypothetical protein